MIRRELKVTNLKGIHARPSALIVQAAQGFKSRITFEHNGECADATDIMAVLALGVARGETLLATTDGPDESAAIDRIAAIFALDFNDN